MSEQGFNFHTREGEGGGLLEEEGTFECCVCEWWYQGIKKNIFTGDMEPSGAYILQVKDDEGEIHLFYFFVKESLGNRRMPSRTRKFFNAILGGTDVDDAFANEPIPGPEWWVKDQAGNHRHVKGVFEKYTKKSGEEGLKLTGFFPFKGTSWGPINYIDHETRQKLKDQKGENGSGFGKPPF